MSQIGPREDEWMKFILICKPEQSGKTFIMIQKIIKDLEEPVDDRVVVNIILCDNNLLLTKQTTVRISDSLEEYEVNGETYLEFSSHKRTDYHDAVSVEGAIAAKGIKNILCCTNGTRIDDIYTIVSELNESHLTKGKIFFKVWLDEADKFTGFIDTTFRPLVDEYENIQVYCITATPKKLFDKYNYMNVLPLENTTEPNYHGWSDNDINLVDFDASCEDFIRFVLEKEIREHGPITPGTKWYVPAEHKKSSHEAVKEICVRMGFAVIVINGEGIRLTLPNRDMHTFKKDDELNPKVKDIYSRYSLDRFPLAITGNICIGRGISIMSEDFMMDYGILSSCHNQQEASQNSGRLKGNIKNWSTYKPPKVFTTERFDNVAKVWESKSRKLAELAFKKEAEGKSTMVSKAEFKTLDEDYECIVHPDLFSSFAQAQKFLTTKSRAMKTKKKETKKGAIHLRDGYAVSSKLLKPGQKVEDLTAEDRIIHEQATNPQAVGYISDGRCISSTDKGSRYLILPVYESMDTAPNKEKYQVRYISFKRS
jgi:hypothetical protein